MVKLLRLLGFGRAPEPDRQHMDVLDLNDYYDAEHRIQMLVRHSTYRCLCPRGLDTPSLHPPRIPLSRRGEPRRRP